MISNKKKILKKQKERENRGKNEWRRRNTYWE